jgi:hypothetical protein
MHGSDLSYTVYDEERGLYILNLGEEHLLVNEEGLFVIDLIKQGMGLAMIQERFEARFKKSISEEELEESKILLGKLEAPTGESYLEIPLISDIHKYAVHFTSLSTWVINRKVGIGVLLLFVVALWQMSSHFSAFVLTTTALIELPVLGWLVCLTYVAVTVIFHEVMHILACEKYGVAPGECGFRIKMIFPFLYIKIPSSWQCSQKDRIAISAAGSASNMVFSSIAIFFIVYYPLQEHMHTALIITVYSNLFTLLAVANPFMKEDGYNIVSDMLKVPNLMSRAVEYIKAKIKREDFEYLSPYEKIVFPLYAAGLVVFRVLLYSLTVFILYRVISWILETLHVL